MSNDRNFRESHKRIAQEIGYLSNQVLVQVLVNHRQIRQSDFLETQQ